MHMAGVAVSDVSQAFGCTRQTIHMLMTRYVHTGTVLDHQRTARPRATTARSDRFITLAYLSRRILPATVVVRRYCLRKNFNNPIRARRLHKGQIMTRRHRLAWV